MNASPLLLLRGARVLGAGYPGAPVLDVTLSGEHLVSIGTPAAPTLDVPPQTKVIDLSGRWLMPGFVQSHIHLVQTLFRGLADDLQLLDWLRTRIWPFERAHDEESVYASARLGITELLLGGTTAALDMATVHHTDAVFRAAEESGFRLTAGKAMMDVENEAGLSEPTERSLRSAGDLADRWHGKGRLRYAYAPRFVPSCTERLLRDTATEARRRGCLIHTHASENRHEVELVRAMTGRDNVEWLAEVGLAGPDVALAHCIHLTEAEERLLAERGTRLLHCPSSNLKLASGVARIPELIARGVHVSIGADGAPCNNRLDMFAELRLAALLPKPRLGADAMPAGLAFRLATRHGAEALGLDAGEFRAGALADFTILDQDVLWSEGDPEAAVVYTLDPRAVREVWIGGRPVVQNGAVAGWDLGETVSLARSALERVRARAGV